MIGCIIELLITKGKQKPHAVLVMIWPMFLIISMIIIIGEMTADKK